MTEVSRASNGGRSRGDAEADGGRKPHGIGAVEVEEPGCSQQPAVPGCSSWNGRAGAEGSGVLEYVELVEVRPFSASSIPGVATASDDAPAEVVPGSSSWRARPNAARPFRNLDATFGMSNRLRRREPDRPPGVSDCHGGKRYIIGHTSGGHEERHQRRRRRHKTNQRTPTKTTSSPEISSASLTDPQSSGGRHQAISLRFTVH